MGYAPGLAFGRMMERVNSPDVGHSPKIILAENGAAKPRLTPGGKAEIA